LGTKATPQTVSSGPSAAAKTASRAADPGPRGPLSNSFPRAGNQAIGRLLQAAAGDSGAPLELGVREPLEHRLGKNLKDVRVHTGANSAAAAEDLGARAYTLGSDVYLGKEAERLDSEGRRKLLTHEAIHTVQQGGARALLAGSIPVSHPNDPAEREARGMAQGSQALAMRDALRVSAVTPHIQRDIEGDSDEVQKMPQGRFVVDFAKYEGTKAGDDAGETGSIKFTPSDTAPESDHINLIQVIREFDTTTGKDYDRPGDLRSQAQTKQDTKKNVAGGFFVDFNVDTAKPRTNKSDPAVSAVYPHMAQEGASRRGKTPKDAVLADDPHFDKPLKYNFVTVARATDKGDNHGVVYGTVLWGFEIFHDQGIAKIKNEYVNFRVTQGETFDAALQKFNDVFKNPGTAGAPAK
jgi:hypothetical protein